MGDAVRCAHHILRGWGMKRERKSPDYTTNWDQLPRVS
ncbi:MAG: DUF4113 domain-containing protein [Betaproteobacteria bacterium]|nr:DUF4113 domain-containing protein [Betaproteobacteria bacterium]